MMEDLAYRRLLDAYYLGERALNGCVSDVARSVGMVEHLEAVGYVLKTYFQHDGDQFSNKRCDAELAHYLDKKEKNSSAGKASAQRRLDKKATSVEILATDVQPTMNHEPVTSNQEPVTKGRRQAQAPNLVLPDWINRVHWDAWHSSPKRKKATGEQRCMAVAKLSEWRDAGQDHAGALENAAVGGYQGLFLPDKPKQAASGETAYQRSMRERVEEFSPEIARKQKNVLEVFDVVAITRN